MSYINKPLNLSKVWATTGVKETPVDSKINQGWVVELPPYQYDNWLENKQDSAIAHFNQLGVPVWDSTTEYQGGRSYVQGSNGVVYKALVTNTNIDPTNPLNSTQWVKAFEDFGTVQIVQTTLNNHLTNYSTLAGIANVNAARTNLSVWSRSESDVRYASLAGNSSQTFSVANATNDTHAINRGQLYSLLNQATETAKGIAEIANQSEMDIGTNDTNIVTPLKGKATYLMRTNNLSDLGNVAQARTNLGLSSAATTNIADFLLKSGNLAGLANVSTARVNLGLGTMAVENAADWLSKSGNLAGLSNVSTARTNLGLGDSAIRNIGTSTNTVAAGDDPRIVNAVQNSRQVIAGNGLAGGGALINNVAIALGTPGTIGATSSNSVSETSHTHAFDINSFFGNRLLVGSGYQVFPGGLIIQWGGAPDTNTGTNWSVWNFPIKFPNGVFMITGSAADNSTSLRLKAFATIGPALADGTGVQFAVHSNSGTRLAINCNMIAIGF